MRKGKFEQKLKNLTKQLTTRKFILFIASSLMIVLICLLLFVFHNKQSSVSHSETIQSSSQVNNQPREGKDYKIQYSNSSLIKRSTLNTALKKAGLDIEASVGPGKHEWYYWNKQIERVLEWLPINYVQEERLS